MSARTALVAVLSFQGLSGVAGGLGLMGDPTGGTLGIPLQWLRGSPFGDYLIPGMVLLTVLGLFPLLMAWGLWQGRRWARTGSVVVGLALIVWLGVEIAVIGYVSEPPLQLVYGIVAALILALAFAPGVRRDTAG